MKKRLLIATALCVPGVALAASPPATVPWASFTGGTVPNATQFQQGATVTNGLAVDTLTTPAATITGGAVDGTPIGSTTPSTIKGTTASLSSTLNVSGLSTLASISTTNGTTQLPIKSGSVNMLLIGGTPADIEPQVPILLSPASVTLTSTMPAFLHQNATYTGTSTSGAAGFGAFLQQTDAGANIALGTGIDENLIVTGGSWVGQRRGGQINLTVTGAGANTDGVDFNGLGVKCQLGITTPASPATRYSGCFGLNTVASGEPTIIANMTASIAPGTGSNGAPAGQGLLTVIGTPTGVLAANQFVNGIANPTIAGTMITGPATVSPGSGAAGNYIVNNAQTVAQEGMVSNLGMTVNNITGYEPDVDYGINVTGITKLGLAIVDITAGAHPSQDDIALTINNQYAPSATHGWQYGIAFGKFGGQFPVEGTGTLIFGEALGGNSWSVANGVDWHLGTFTGNSWNDGHVQLTGAGDALLNSATTLATAATAGFVHLPHTAAAPTGTPANTTGPACEWNTATHNLNCYDGSAWYHVTGTSGAL